MAKTAKPSVDENAVRDRAYLMWEADGRPDGRSEHYWGLAYAEATAPKRKRAAASGKAAGAKAAGAKAAGAKSAADKPAKPAKSKKKK